MRVRISHVEHCCCHIWSMLVFVPVWSGQCALYCIQICEISNVSRVYVKWQCLKKSHECMWDTDSRFAKALFNLVGARMYVIHFLEVLEWRPNEVVICPSNFIDWKNVRNVITWINTDKSGYTMQSFLNCINQCFRYKEYKIRRIFFYLLPIFWFCFEPAMF